MAVGEVIAFLHARNKCTHGSVNSSHIATDEETFVSAFPKKLHQQQNLIFPDRKGSGDDFCKISLKATFKPR